LKAWPQLLNAVGRTITELDLYSPSSKRLHLALEEPFAIYSRIAFDNYLRDRARDAGAQIVSEKISAGRRREQTPVGNLTSDSGSEWRGTFLVGADGANSGIAKMLAGPLPPSDMEVAFGYRAPLPPTTRARRWLRFCRLGRLRVGISASGPHFVWHRTTQDAFEHQPLDDLLWQFMIGYYQQCDSGRR
jgi:flavin-dependent dehydrogenase